MASSKEMMKRAAAKRAAARIPVLNAGEFKVGKTTLVAGNWIGWDEGPYYLRGLVCDNKFDGGFCVYAFNESYPNGHEGAYVSPKSVWLIDEDEVASEIPADVLKEANKFLKLARRVNFE